MQDRMTANKKRGHPSKTKSAHERQPGEMPGPEKVRKSAQWEWDMPDIGGGRLYSGENNWIYFIPGTAEDNGTWYHGTTSTGGTVSTRNGRVIDLAGSSCTILRLFHP